MQIANLLSLEPDISTFENFQTTAFRLQNEPFWV